MKKFFVLLLLFLLTFLFPNQVWAQDCSEKQIRVNMPTSFYSGQKSSITFTVDLSSKLTTGETYNLVVENHGIQFASMAEKKFVFPTDSQVTISGDNLALNRKGVGIGDDNGERHVLIHRGNGAFVCKAGMYTILARDKLPSSCILHTNPNCIDKTTSRVVIAGNNLSYRGDLFSGPVVVHLSNNVNVPSVANNGAFVFDINPSILNTTTPIIVDIFDGATKTTACQSTITVYEQCTSGMTSLQSTKTNSIVNVDIYKCGTNGLQTGLGCIPTELGPFITWFLGFAISIGGGIAFLLFSWGSFLLITSSGNPEQVKNGQDTLVSAGAGLLFIIFSVTLLRIIGFDILKIPGFGP